MGGTSRRQIRLEKERERLEAINQDSDYVRVIPLDGMPGRSPERYKVTFTCRGIVAIDNARDPMYGLQHEVTIYCHQDFPSDVPWLRWETPIWHPNIEHYEPKNVCVNKKEWLGGMTLADLCQQLFEMVQYKNYHAENTWPYPLDSEAAAWVREYAEPKGLVDKKRGKSVDALPFYKPTAIQRMSRIQILPPVVEGASGPRIRIQRGPAQTSTGLETRVGLQAGAKMVRCSACRAELPTDSQFCDKCGAQVKDTKQHAKFGN